MKRYDEKVLNALLDSLERRGRSAVSLQDMQIDAQTEEPPAATRGIFYRIDQKHLPEYFDSSAFAFETIHEQMSELESKGLVKLHWRAGRVGHILEKVELVKDHAPESYTYLKRIPKDNKEEQIRECCSSWMESVAGEAADAPSCPVLSAFLTWTVQRLAEHRSIQQYADINDPVGFDRLCRMMFAMEKNTEDRYLREFSISTFHDSKAAENLMGKAVQLIREFGGDAYAKLTADEILEEFGVFRNPVWTYMKGWGVFEITGSGSGKVYDLSALKEGVGLTGADLDRLQWNSLAAPLRIVTIENLTSFHQWKTAAGTAMAEMMDMKDMSDVSARTLVIYLGGYAGRRKCAFLRRIYAAYPRASYHHFGDIDCGGFRIWRALCEGTGIPFMPYRMDIAAWEQYAQYGRPLTTADRRQLEQMLDDPYYAGQKKLFRRMLDAGIKLEQECM